MNFFGQYYNFRIVWLVQINSIQQSQISDRTSFKKDLGRNFGSPGERNYSSFLCVENPVKTINFLAMDCMKDYLRSFIDHIFRGERIFHHNGWPKNCRFFHQLSNPKKSYFTRKWMDRGEKLGNLILTSFEVVFFLLNLLKSILKVLLKIEKKTFLWISQFFILFWIGLKLILFLDWFWPEKPPKTIY